MPVIQSSSSYIAPPFSAALVLAYLSEVYLRSSSYSSVVLAHAALKWFHTLLPISTLNPSNSAPCQQLLEATKRSKPPIHKKEPVTPDMIKEIIVKHGSSSTSLKDLLIVAICCIGFVGFFRYEELSLLSPAHFHLKFLIILEFSSPRLRTTSTEKGTMYISRG